MNRGPWFLALTLCALTRAWGVEHFKFYPDWFPGAQFAGVYLALDRGYYREAGLDFEIVPFAFGQKANQSIADAPATAAAASIEGYIFFQKRAAGVDWRAFGAVLQRSPAGYMSLAEHPLTGGKDFTGKIIGVHKFGDPLYHYFLGRAGVGEHEAKMIFVNNDPGDLISGRVAAMQGFATEEFVLLRDKVGDRARFISFADLGFDSYSQVLVTLPRQVEEHRAAFGKFIAATRRGWEDALAAPDAAVRSIHLQVGAACDDAFQRKSLLALPDYITPNGARPLSPLAATKLEKLEQTCVEIGFIKVPEAVAKYVVELEK